MRGKPQGTMTAPPGFVLECKLSESHKAGRGQHNQAVYTRHHQEDELLYVRMAQADCCNKLASAKPSSAQAERRSNEA